jgi:hypothetical protein
LLRRFSSVPLPDERIPNGHQWYDYEDWRRQVVGQDVNVARVVQLNHRWIFFGLLEGDYRALRSLENHLVVSFARFVQPGFTSAKEPDAMISLTRE